MPENMDKDLGLPCIVSPYPRLESQEQWSDKQSLRTSRTAFNVLNDQMLRNAAGQVACII